MAGGGGGGGGAGGGAPSTDPGSSGRRNAGQGYGGEVRAGGAAASVGDHGCWSASMQALCTMLRSRRCDPSLAALIFLALESCIGEWAQACEAGLDRAAARSGGACRALQVSSVVTVEGGVAAPKGWEGGEQWLATSGAVTPAQKGALKPEPPFALAATVATRHVPTGARGKEASAALAAREKMELGTKESLKASLVWAEAVALGRPRQAVADRGDRRGPRPSSSGFVSGGGAVQSQAHQTTSETKAPDASFSAVIAEAVERLTRYDVSPLGVVGAGMGTSGPPALLHRAKL